MTPPESKKRQQDDRSFSPDENRSKRTKKSNDTRQMIRSIDQDRPVSRDSQVSRQNSFDETRDDPVDDVNLIKTEKDKDQGYKTNSTVKM